MYTLREGLRPSATEAGCVVQVGILGRVTAHTGTRSADQLCGRHSVALFVACCPPAFHWRWKLRLPLPDVARHTIHHFGAALHYAGVVRHLLLDLGPHFLLVHGLNVGKNLVAEVCVDDKRLIDLIGVVGFPPFQQNLKGLLKTVLHPAVEGPAKHGHEKCVGRHAQEQQKHTKVAKVGEGKLSQAAHQWNAWRRGPIDRGRPFVLFARWIFDLHVRQPSYLLHCPLKSVGELGGRDVVLGLASSYSAANFIRG
mmetsp:Transcript_7855/g.23729  ORF Transcript_7855/g.23729 Transcript_7855/m.23729 type:complete len:254 (+) Transcript_7855:1387-2148(+)